VGDKDFRSTIANKMLEVLIHFVCLGPEPGLRDVEPPELPYQVGVGHTGELDRLKLRCIGRGVPVIVDYALVILVVVVLVFKRDAERMRPMVKRLFCFKPPTVPG